MIGNQSAGREAATQVLTERSQDLRGLDGPVRWFEKCKLRAHQGPSWGMNLLPAHCAAGS